LIDLIRDKKFTLNLHSQECDWIHSSVEESLRKKFIKGS